MPPFALPLSVITSPALSTLLPIVLGTSVGYLVNNFPTSNTKRTYVALRQPPLRPPAWVFGPVWTILYGLMGYASHRVGPHEPNQPLYSFQLVLNYMWMPLFFSLQKPKAALADILILTGTVGVLGKRWWTVDRIAGWCFVPYVSWLAFATYITAGVGVLNRWDIKSAVERYEKGEARRRE